MELGGEWRNLKVGMCLPRLLFAGTLWGKFTVSSSCCFPFIGPSGGISQSWQQNKAVSSHSRPNESTEPTVSPASVARTNTDSAPKAVSSLEAQPSCCDDTFPPRHDNQLHLGFLLNTWLEGLRHCGMKCPNLTAASCVFKCNVEAGWVHLSWVTFDFLSVCCWCFSSPKSNVIL